MNFLYSSESDGNPCVNMVSSISATLLLNVYFYGDLIVVAMYISMTDGDTDTLLLHMGIFSYGNILIFNSLILIMLR